MHKIKTQQGDSLQASALRVLVVTHKMLPVILCNAVKRISY